MMTHLGLTAVLVSLPVEGSDIHSRRRIFGIDTEGPSDCDEGCSIFEKTIQFEDNECGYYCVPYWKHWARDLLGNGRSEESRLGLGFEEEDRLGAMPVGGQYPMDYPPEPEPEPECEECSWYEKEKDYDNACGYKCVPYWKHWLGLGKGMPLGASPENPPEPVCDACPDYMDTVPSDNSCGFECVETVPNCDACPEGMRTVPADNPCGFDCLDYDSEHIKMIKAKNPRCASKWWKFWECFMPKFEVLDDEGNVVSTHGGRRRLKSADLARRLSLEAGSRRRWGDFDFDEFMNENHDTSNDRNEWSNSEGFNGLSKSESGFDESFTDFKNGDSGFSRTDPWGRSSSGTSKFFDNKSGGRKFKEFNDEFTGHSGFEDVFGERNHKMNDDRTSDSFSNNDGSFGRHNFRDFDESMNEDFGFSKEHKGPGGLFSSHKFKGSNSEDKSHDLDEKEECDRWGNCRKSRNESKSHSTSESEEEHKIHHDPDGNKWTSKSWSSSTSDSSSTSKSWSNSGRRLEAESQELMAPGIGLEKSTAF